MPEETAHPEFDGHRHGHLSGGASMRVARLLRWITLGCGVVVVMGAAVLWPSGQDVQGDPLGLDSERVDAHVLAVEQAACEGDPAQQCTLVISELSGGAAEGELATIELGGSTPVRAGDDIQLVPFERADGVTAFSFYDFQRSQPLTVLLVLFAAAVIALGRWRGVGALAGLAASLLAIVWFALPSLIDGNNAMAVALVTAGAVAFLALYLAHGVGPATDVALLSTFASLALTAGLGWLFVEFGQLTGFTDDASFVLQALGAGIDARGILLAGIVIGSLGVLDDVTVTQVSAVWQLHEARPSAGRLQLFRSALTIGRDHISSTVNTLFLAYAGAALPLLLLFSGIGASVTDVATREIVATEIVRALVGSIGLVASVPISTWLAVQVVTASDDPRGQPALR